VVGVVGEDGEGAVELFDEDDAGELMGEGHGAKGEEQIARLRSEGASGALRPAVGGADGEDQVLSALIAAAFDPPGEFLGGEGLAARVEQNQGGRGAGAQGGDGFGEGGLGAVVGGFDGSVWGEALEIVVGDGLEGVFAGARADGRDGEPHGTSVGQD
jgi:hypothetical protein